MSSRSLISLVQIEPVTGNFEEDISQGPTRLLSAFGSKSDGQIFHTKLHRLRCMKFNLNNLIYDKVSNVQAFFQQPYDVISLAHPLLLHTTGRPNRSYEEKLRKGKRKPLGANLIRYCKVRV